MKAAVLKLYRDGRRVDAIRHYANATGTDITTAKDVVERIAGSAPSPGSTPPHVSAAPASR